MPTFFDRLRSLTHAGFQASSLPYLRRLQVWVYPYVMATVNVPLTVPPNPAQFKNSENTIASARQLAGTPVLAVTFIEFDKCWPVGCKTFP